jgi:hypothetical protein
MDALRKPVEALPAFQEAVGCVNDEDGDRAIQLLKPLVESYPDSPLVRTYLTFAFDNQGMTRDAEAEFKKALSLPDITRVLLAWASKNRDLETRLQQFAASRIQEAERRVAAAVLCEDEEREFWGARRESFELAAKALGILRVLGRDSDVLQILDATVEEFYGHYYSALTRLSRVINAAAEKEESRNGPEDNLAMEWLFTSHAVRCQVAIRWVEHAKRDGTLSDFSTALDLLHKAEERDLVFCKRFLEYRSHYLEDTSRFKEFQLLKSRLRLRLIQGEIELELGMNSGARQHLEGREGAKELQAAVSKAANELLLVAPKMERLKARLHNALNRLHAQDASHTVGANPSQGRIGENRSRPA